MSITVHDVKHIAALARLAVDDNRAAMLVGELNDILGHMDVLQRVALPDVAATDEVIGMPQRDDVPGAVTLSATREQFAPAMLDGFFLVPRLTTHTTAGASTTDASSHPNDSASASDDDEETA